VARSKLERALENNKQLVLQLMKNDHPTIGEIQAIIVLRVDAKRLTHEISNEIQCEQRNFLCIPPNECKFILIKSTYTI
jgi:hypothetical protein